MLDFFVENWSQILIAVLIFIAWADFSYKLDKIEKIQELNKKVEIKYYHQPRGMLRIIVNIFLVIIDF